MKRDSRALSSLPHQEAAELAAKCVESSVCPCAHVQAPSLSHRHLRFNTCASLSSSLRQDRLLLPMALLVAPRSPGPRSTAVGIVGHGAWASRVVCVHTRSGSRCTAASVSALHRMRLTGTAPFTTEGKTLRQQRLHLTLRAARLTEV